MEEINNKRSKLIRNNIILSFFTKGWSAIILLLTVPVTLNCLGDYKNGVWLTISSLLLWIENMDIGLGNGLRNTLAIHLAHNDIQKAKSGSPPFLAPQKASREAPGRAGRAFRRPHKGSQHVPTPPGGARQKRKSPRKPTANTPNEAVPATGSCESRNNRRP